MEIRSWIIFHGKESEHFLLLVDVFLKFSYVKENTGFVCNFISII